MRSSPAKGWAKTRQMAPPLAQSSPPGKEEQGGESRREGKALRNRREEMNLSGSREGCQRAELEQPELRLL